jgi:2-amino-4-hydroxy-6-hydroxymethyldihydropteridine diphosphokinase
MKAAQAFVGIGANVGDRWATIQRAIDRLKEAPGVALVECSPVFETDPVGLLDQPLFLNLVGGLETTLSPEELLARLQQIEQELGRKRTVRWGPRTIDLDLLLYAGEIRCGPELELPHPRMFERAFVVEPLRLLLHAPRFANAVWGGTREQLEALPRGTGLRPWPPA